MKTKKELRYKIERLEEEIRDLKRENDVQFVELRQYREAEYEKRCTDKREKHIDALVEYRKKLVEGGFSGEEATDIIRDLLDRGCIVY